jgi:ribosomal-protein-alanine N-acetyltransferase
VSTRAPSRVERADVTLRTARLEDLREIAAIERLSFTDPWSRQSFAQLLDGPAHFVVAERPFAGARVVAGYVVAWVVVEQAEIANIAVAPSARRLGIGALLLDDAIAALAARGARAIFLEVRRSNEAAQALYASRGFREVGRRRGYYRNPVEDALILRYDTQDSPSRDM